MGIPVLILGESGSGKTYSIKNFDVDEVGIFSVEKNRLPFRKQFKVVKNAGYPIIMKALSAPTLKRYVVDDSQYLLVNEFFDRAKETGYQKFTDLALNFRNLIHYVYREMPDDVIVYLVMHEETSDYGETKLKTIGKLLDQKVCVEGMVTVCLRAMKEGTDRYCFRTQSDGSDISKSPEGMFELKIDNDLKAVDAKIREYWGM